MARKKDAFFNSTQEALDKLTQMYDLVWPIDVSLRYMRRKVTEFSLNSQFELRPEDFEEEFDPQHRTHGVNYTRAFIYSGRNHTEQEKNEKILEASQQENLAWLLLCNTIPIFESWWKYLAEEVGFSGMNEAGMEFPTNSLDTRKKGIQQQIIELTTVESSIFKNVFYDLYSSKKNHCSNLNELNLSMYAYRLFKEIRNCYMHNGGVVSNKITDSVTGKPWITVAHDEYQNNVVAVSATINALGIEELPEFPTDFDTSLGSKLHITLRGVVGFSNIMRRIMLTVDSELIRSMMTEQHFLNMWNNLYSTRTKRFEMPINSEAISYFIKEFNGETVPEDEIEKIKNSFNKQLKTSKSKYEYNSMIHLISSTRLLVPKEITSNLDDLNSPEVQYKDKLIKLLLPFLKSHNLIDSPAL